MYLNWDPDFRPEESIRDVRAYRQRNGIFAFSITFNDSYTPLGIPMEQEDSDRYRRLDPDDRLGFLMQLAIEHLTNMNAQDIVGRINQQATQKTGVRTLPIRQKDYTPEITTAISHILSVNLSRFNVGIGHVQKREWEVGHKSPYDDLDTKMSGTKISM